MSHPPKSNSNTPSSANTPSNVIRANLSKPNKLPIALSPSSPWSPSHNLLNSITPATPFLNPSTLTTPRAVQPVDANHLLNPPSPSRAQNGVTNRVLSANYRAAVDMSGWVQKCQSRMPSSVRRFFRLSDSVLYNHAQLTTRPTWKLSVSHATVRADYDRNLIVLTCLKRHVRFQLTTGAETHRWLVALRTAAFCNVNDFYELGRTIGTGSFGTVREAIDKATGVRRAIKIVHRTSDQKEREFLTREMSVLLTISHPNIVRTFDIFDERHRILVVMQFVPGGDLFEYVARYGTLQERIAKHVIWQVMTGICYLHGHNIVHRDIKLENVLVAQDNPLRLLLTDFGFANYIDPCTEEPAYDLKSLVGTGSYMSPEVIDGRGHGKPVDIFAAGVVMYRVLAGQMPFRAISLKESYKLAVGERADFASRMWQNVSTEGRTLCRSLLSADPGRRPTAGEVLGHNWFLNDESFIDEAADAEAAARLKERRELQREQELYDKACDSGTNAVETPTG